MKLNFKDRCCELWNPFWEVNVDYLHEFQPKMFIDNAGSASQVHSIEKQAGNGPSHFKGLQSAKYSLRQNPCEWKMGFLIFFWSPVSRIVPKNVKGAPVAVFEIYFFAKLKKMKKRPFGDLKKICEKSLTKPKKPAQKIFGHRRDSNPSFCLADLKKSSKKLEAEAATLVWQLVEASL